METKTTGTVRGMHYQAQPCAEAKLLLCLKGEIYDVVVDIRSWAYQTCYIGVAAKISAELGQGILIPAGFAHGYQCLSDNVSLLYFHDTAHDASSERGINPRDPRLGIAWPLPVENLSKRDLEHAFIDKDFAGELI